TALPRNATFYNLGVAGATVAGALADQLPEALRLEPTLVTVWLNVNDLLRLVSASSYEDDLTGLLTGLRRGGETRVLVANTPPLDRLPVYLACRAATSATTPRACPLGEVRSFPGPEAVQAAVGAYNQAVARAAAAAGAEVVDLHALGLAARAGGTEAALVSADGFHPSTAGYQAVAGAFAAALARRP
ncbi:MAG: SGNH/GDSL hydrolase family protein, partial [Acidimicrobiales bacterium]